MQMAFAVPIIYVLKKYFPDINIQVLFHQGKQHGLYMGNLKQIQDNSLILLPDASVADKKPYLTY